MLVSMGVAQDARLGIGCSGGPDSTVLAHAASALRERGLVGPVVLVHVDHGLRPDSAADAEQVRELGSRLGAAVEVRAVVVDRSRASLEAAARQARYRAFERVAEDLGLRWILLGHTASDQAETVLMRMLRGTGVPGLAAIPRVRGLYLRPLLDTTRDEVEAYLEAHGLTAARDPMNEDPRFVRSRVRHHWLPALRRENPDLDRALCRLAESARQQREVLDAAADELIARARESITPGAHPHAPAKGGVALAADELRQAPAAVARRALARAATIAGAGTLGERHIRALHELALQPVHGSVWLDLPGARALREYGVLIVGATAPAQAMVLRVEGPEPPYQVRTWRPGDRMRPARLKGRSRKLSDLFIDAKVPRRMREHALVVVRDSDGTIEWAEHIGPAWESHVAVVLTSPDPAASNKVTE